MEQKFRQTLEQLRTQLGRVILGKPEVIERLIVAVLSGGHVLMEDLPGVGKTTLAKTLAKSLNADFKRVQFTPDLLPTDILGSSIYSPGDGSFTFKPGPIFTNILLADEINRASPRTQSSLRLDPFEGLTTPLSADIEIYGVVNREEDDVAQPGAATPEALEEALALPADTDARFGELAARLVADSPPTAERVRRTVDAVKNAAHYSLRAGRFHSQQPAAEFFFEKKQGYCQYFATAAVILLRLEGVPARYVTGFEVEEGNREGGHYVVRELDAHAWIEAYVPGRGWVEADPTPEAEYESLHANARAGWKSSLREWLAGQWAEISIRLRGGDWFAAWRWMWRGIKSFAQAISLRTLALGVILGALLLLAVRLGLRRFRSFGTSRRAFHAEQARADGVAPELADLLARVDSVWARAGFRRPPTQAPLEHLSNIAPEKISPALREASRKAVECYYGARYAGLRIAPAEIWAAQRELEQASASARRS